MREKYRLEHEGMRSKIPLKVKELGQVLEVISERSPDDWPPDTLETAARALLALGAAVQCKTLSIDEHYSYGVGLLGDIRCELWPELREGGNRWPDIYANHLDIYANHLRRVS